MEIGKKKKIDIINRRSRKVKERFIKLALKTKQSTRDEKNLHKAWMNSTGRLLVVYVRGMREDGDEV